MINVIKIMNNIDDTTKLYKTLEIYFIDPLKGMELIKKKKP